MGRKKIKNKGVVVTPFDEVLFRLLEYVTKENAIYYSNLEKVLFEDHIIKDFLMIDIQYTGGHIVEILNKMLNRLEPAKNIKVVQWLYKGHLISIYRSEDKKQKFYLDHLFINVLKELLWMSYYLSTKSSYKVTLLGNPIECLCRLQGVYLTLTNPTKEYEVNKRKYVINALSLKDSRYDLLPYPDQIDPIDLENILIENGLVKNIGKESTREPDLFWAVKSLGKDPCTVYERYHVFKFVKDLVKEALEDKYNT